jgi:hypothetical protein
MPYIDGASERLRADSRLIETMPITIMSKKQAWIAFFLNGNTNPKEWIFGEKLYSRISAADFIARLPASVYLCASHSRYFHLKILCNLSTCGKPLECRCYIICKLRYTTLHMYFQLMVAMFDFPVTPTSESIHAIQLILFFMQWMSSNL